MKVIPATLTFLTVAIGVCFFMQPRKSPPLDLRDAVADKNSADFDTTLPTFEKYNAINVPQPKAVAVERSPKGHTFKPEVPIDWVAINSGRFMMGPMNPPLPSCLKTQGPAMRFPSKRSI